MVMGIGTWAGGTLPLEHLAHTAHTHEFHTCREGPAKHLLQGELDYAGMSGPRAREVLFKVHEMNVGMSGYKTGTFLRSRR